MFRGLKNQKRKGAFTLLELLCVIAIIGIVASLLFPGLSRTKQKGQHISCLNNTRQQVIAILLYSEDYENVLPPVSSENEDGNEISWTKLIQDYYPSRAGFLCPSDKFSKEI